MSTPSHFDAHYLAIGRMLVLFQSLEATLKDGLVLLMNNQMGTPGGQLAYATVAELSFGASLRLASALPGVFTVERLGVPEDADAVVQLETTLAAIAKKLHDGVKMASDVEQRRNQLVHSRWFISSGIVAPPDKMTRMKTKTRAGLMTTTVHSESLDDVNGITQVARDAQVLIGAALREYRQVARAPSEA